MNLSVIVPTCQRPAQLARCLEGIQAAAAHPGAPRPEVIVTDDSRDACARTLVCERFAWANWTAGPRRGPAANRNHGARQARGEWLVFVDDDCEPAPGWLAAFARAVASDSADVLEGLTFCPDAPDSPFIERVENLQGGVLWSCNLALRRTTFEQLAGFDEAFTEAGGEDMELAWRLREQGCRTCFLPDARVVHPPRRIGWRQIWWRNFLMRWMLLYRLKTRQSPPLAASAGHVLGWLVLQQATELARTTLHFVTRFEIRRWQSRLFFLFWKWVTFPLLWPYLAAWELRFRRQERGRRGISPVRTREQRAVSSLPYR